VGASRTAATARKSVQEFSAAAVHTFTVRLVNGYFCRNCADEELAKRGVDPAHPQQEFSGSEVYVPPQPKALEKPELGVNRPERDESIRLGRALNLFA
jgi:hypothetical protein